MGRRGPPARPTALRVLEGSDGRNLGHRPLPKGEPLPPPGMPTCPPGMSLEVQKEFRVQLEKLRRVAGLVTTIDGPALGNLCLLIVQLRKAQAVLDKNGFTVVAPSGYRQQRPEVAIVRASLYLLRQYLSEFGMTPAARARISLAEEGEEDDAGILS